MRHESDDISYSSSNDVRSSRWNGSQLTEDDAPSSSSSRLSQRTVVVMLLSIIIALCVAGYSNSYGFPNHIITWHTGTNSGDGSPSSGVYLSSDANADPDIPLLSTDELRLTATNEYGVYDAPYPWLRDGTGAQLVEPMKRTTLTARYATIILHYPSLSIIIEVMQ